MIRTPDIKEFHVGFKYQRNDGNGWNDCVCNGYDIPGIITMLNITIIKQAIEKSGSIEEAEKLYNNQNVFMPKGFNWRSVVNEKNYHERIRVYDK